MALLVFSTLVVVMLLSW